MSNLVFIYINKEDMVERQKSLKTFISEEWELNPYTTSYWYGHLAEEVDEYLENLTLDELADVIVFLQALSVLLYGRLLLMLRPNVVRPRPLMVLTKLGQIRKYLPRKSWKSTSIFPYENWVKWCEEFIGLLITMGDHSPEEVKLAYEKKLEYNLARTDWSR